MKIIFYGKPAEFYKSICCSRAFNRISSRYGNVALFYYRMLEMSLKDLEDNKVLYKKAQSYIEKKMDHKQKFCFLIAPKEIF